MTLQAPKEAPLVDAADYRPEDDVARLASYFAQKYGDLDAAQKSLDPEIQLDLHAFEQALKRWGVKVDNVVELFDHIDVDWSGTISVQELLSVLDSPVEQIQRREAERRRIEVKRIFEELAGCIRAKYGSVEEALGKHGVNRVEDVPVEAAARRGLGLAPSADPLARRGTVTGITSVLQPSGTSTLSLAQFRTLVKGLDMDLDANLLLRVFNEIDDDRTGFVSVQELHKALSYHMARTIILELADGLTKYWGNVVKAFEDIGELVPGAIPKVVLPAAAIPGKAVPTPPHVLPPPPPVSTSGVDPITGQPFVSEEKLQRLFRQLKMQDVVSESSAKTLHHSLKPFTIEDLVRRLQDEHTQAEELRRRRQEDKEKHEKDRKRLLSESLRVDSYHRAEKEVNSWLGRALASKAQKPPVVTAKWQGLARNGTSKTQLRDYISVLESLLEERTTAVEEMQIALEQDWRELEGLKDFLADQSSRGYATPTPFPNSTPVQGQQGRSPFFIAGGLGDLTPMTPVTPSWLSRVPPATPAGGLDATLQQETKTVRVERLLQAATVGDIGAVQRFLSSHTNPDSIAWGGVTALMSAARHAQVEVLKLLISFRADPVRTDMYGRTALDHAQQQPQKLRDWLRGRGILGAQELGKIAEALSSQLLEAEAQKQKMTALRDQLPSGDVMRRARHRQRLQQQKEATPQAVRVLPPQPCLKFPPEGAPSRGAVTQSTIGPSSAGASVAAFDHAPPSFGKQVKLSLPA